MNCRDVREMADSFLCEELLTETNHEILRHLDSCPLCRTEFDARRRLRGALRDAFTRAPELQPSAEFQERLRARVREVPIGGRRRWFRSPTWWAVAAGIIAAVGLAAIISLRRSASPADVLASDAIGDHKNCALKYRLVRTPVPLEEAAQRFDSAYRQLLSAPPDDIPTSQGPAHVTERHSCEYGSHRFGHVIMEYRGRVVSLLVTASDGGTRDLEHAIPHVIGRPVNGLSVVSVSGVHHAVVLVSDLESQELAQLSRVVSVPLVRRLDVGTATEDRAIALNAGRPIQSLALNSMERPRR